MAKVLEDLNALVALEQKGDPRVARGLPGRYLERGEPCCLVAHLLFRQGVSTGMLREMDRTGGKGGGGQYLFDLKLPVKHRYTELAWELLCYLQGCNDGGMTWEAARDDAFTLDGYWLRVNPKFANKNKPWLTKENALHISRR